MSTKEETNSSNFVSLPIIKTEAITENNSVKYSVYKEHKEWNKSIERFNVALFAFAFLIPTELYFSESIIGSLVRKINPDAACNIGCKIIIGLLSLAILLFSVYPHKAPKVYNPKPLEENEDGKTKVNFKPTR